MSDLFHGWAARSGGPALHIGELPGRKSVCLYTIEAGVIRTHAFFKSSDDAERVVAIIDRLTGVARP